MSSSFEATIVVDCLFEGIDFRLVVSRERFEEINIDLFQKCMDLAEKCLSDTEISKDRVDDVILVGVSTKIPMVQQVMQDFFDGKKLVKRVNPKEVVAFGTVVQAPMLNKLLDEKEANISLLEATTFSLGIEAASGVMTVIVPKHSTQRLPFLIIRVVF